MDFDDECEMVLFLTASMKDEINNGRVLHVSVLHPDHGEMYETRIGDAEEKREAKDVKA